MSKVRSVEADMRISITRELQNCYESVIEKCDSLDFFAENEDDVLQRIYVHKLREHMQECINNNKSYIKSMYDFFEIRKIYKL